MTIYVTKNQWIGKVKKSGEKVDKGTNDIERERERVQHIDIVIWL